MALFVIGWLVDYAVGRGLRAPGARPIERGRDGGFQAGATLSVRALKHI